MKTISLKSVLDSLYSKTKFITDLNPADAIIYALEVLRLINHPLIYKKNKSFIIEIDQYKGILPCDVIQVKQAMALVSKKIYSPITNAQVIEYDVIAEQYPINLPITEEQSIWYRIPMRTSTGNFSSINNGITYSISHNIITTEFKTGYIELSYDGLELDEDNLPVIPDNISVILAIQAYIKYVYAGSLYEVGQMDRVIFEKLEQDYYARVGSAESALHMQQLNNADYVESLSNVINSMIRLKHTHDTGHSTSGSREFLKRF
jgi:hypothetical protein